MLFSSLWHSDEVCERAAQNPSDSGFGDLGAIGGWHDGGARYVAALGGDLVSLTARRSTAARRALKELTALRAIDKRLASDERCDSSYSSAQTSTEQRNERPLLACAAVQREARGLQQSLVCVSALTFELSGRRRWDAPGPE